MREAWRKDEMIMGVHKHHAKLLRRTGEGAAF